MTRQAGNRLMSIVIAYYTSMIINELKLVRVGEYLDKMPYPLFYKQILNWHYIWKIFESSNLTCSNRSSFDDLDSIKKYVKVI